MPDQSRSTSHEGRAKRTASTGARKPRVRPDADPESGSGTKVPMTLKIPESTAMRLKVHSLAVGMTASDVVTELIETHLNKYKITEQGD